MKTKRVSIAVTMGDPAGVGPELCLRLLRDRRIAGVCLPVILGDAGVLRRVAQRCRIPFDTPIVALRGWKQTKALPFPVIVHCDSIESEAVKPGKVQAACGRAAFAYIKEATAAAMSGRVAAIATAPINKESLSLARVPYPGHTEMLASLTGAKHVCMMMACDGMAVSLATIHVPYSEVPGLLTRKQIGNTIELTNAAMKKLGLRNPKLVVCGLNPHAGEHGLFGNEERDIIEPAVRKARAKGMNVEGPLPPDTAFLPRRRKATDAYIVMYHDQGLIPFKMLAFDKGVNITLGLPIVRTSVDHGTAFDIAWKGKASPESLVQSVLWAARLAR
jgi:4-phospho-D-threonate 3-dehydrogenase / 4-phospho-D-erythronate 3-dehydrogenase